jgi:2-oxoglutarate dehydrogenase E2 component (dihydrolipoamide succinyltransferase)
LIETSGQKLKLKETPKSGSVAAPAATYASGTPSQQRKNIRRKNIAPASITGTGKAGRI